MKQYRIQKYMKYKSSFLVCGEEFFTRNIKCLCKMLSRFFFHTVTWPFERLICQSLFQTKISSCDDGEGTYWPLIPIALVIWLSTLHSHKELNAKHKQYGQ